METPPELFIGGVQVASVSTDLIDLRNPATEEVFGQVADASAQDVDRAVTSSRSALADWSSRDPAARGMVLASIAEMHRAHVEEMGALVTRQNGTPISRSRITNGVVPVGIYAEHAELSKTFPFVEEDAQHSVTIREAIGVVGVILPWNAPQVLLANELAPALLSGCTVVLKPSPETSLDALRFAELAVAAGLPPGVLNVITGARDAGAQLVQHRGIDKVAFTGSTDAGRIIAATCGQMLKPFTAELGGKSAAIVLADADLALLAKTLVSTCVPNTGQACYSCTRILVPRSLYAEVLDLVRTTIAATQLGDPMDPATGFGPLVSNRQRERVEGYIQSGIADGARVILGGGRPKDLPRGYYVEPTVFADVTPAMTIFQEEIFGPVLAVSSYDTEDEAVELANASSYGLNGSVYSADQDRARAIARRLQTGSVLINGGHGAPEGPIYGYKDSGYGGMPGMTAYLRIKAIH